MSPTATAPAKTAAPTRPNKLLATFAAGAARPAPPMDDPTAPTPAPITQAVPAPVAQTVPPQAAAPAVAPVTVRPTASGIEATDAAPTTATPPAPQVTAPRPRTDPTAADAAVTPPTAAPVATAPVATAPGVAVRGQVGVRVKQTVELPEEVYEQVQDFARGHRTSFQVLTRALLDDLLTGGDHQHRTRVGALIAAAERDKRARKRRPA